MNKRAITDHIDEHIKGLRIALESTDKDDKKARAHIMKQIRQYEREREAGYLPDECRQFIPNGRG